MRFTAHSACLLISCLLHSSLSSATRFLAVSCTVGEQALLPCWWKSVLKDVDPSPPHIQWRTITAEMVFEQWGVRQWQANEYKDRVQVPEALLDSGDCSLVIKEVQMDDTGKYESFMMVEKDRSRKTRVFIQGVKLSVTNHKSHETRRVGGDLVLDLRTRLSERVVFQSRENSSAWTDVWMRNDKDGQRLEKHPIKEQLTIKNLKSSDAGTYQVLDEHDRAISRVRLSVEGFSEADVFRDAGDRSSSASLLVCFALVASFHVQLQS
ncbi:galectin 17 [Solea solea]|uniref:galectin 17 n=1 Tax=Solea solea TaxID=90069 RepID=UPI00272A2196|nr:galectin 17 [Solea solea]